MKFTALGASTLWQRLLPIRRSRLAKRSLIVSTVAASLLGLVFLGLWWRLSNGPISLDIATPWIQSAIAKNFGDHQSVEIGGTQLERDEHGNAALRILDIKVKDDDGKVVATAPKAEVGFTGSGLLTGNFRAQSLSLVGAKVSVRIEPDGKIVVFAGGNEKPIASAEPKPGEAPGGPMPAPTSSAQQVQPDTPANTPAFRAAKVAALLAWLDELNSSGLDGHELNALGLKSGTLVVDDQRSGKTWTYNDIDLSLTRDKSGVATFSVGSPAPKKPWRIVAAVTAARAGHRTVTLEARNVAANNLLLATRLAPNVDADVPISASMHAEIGADGQVQTVRGRVVVDSGAITDRDDKSLDFPIGHAEVNLDWDATRGVLAAPMQIVSGNNRITLLPQITPPDEREPAWRVNIAGGTVVLGKTDENPISLVLNRIAILARVTPDRIAIEHGNVGNEETGLALSGSIDLSQAEPRIALGFATAGMNGDVLKKLWPFFISPKLRAWVQVHIHKANISRLQIATNATLPELSPGGPPLNDEGLSVEVAATGGELQPVDGLPAIKNATFGLHVAGRKATVTLANGTVQLPSGRRLTVSDATFAVPDTAPDEPDSTTRFRVAGPIGAAVELMSFDKLRGIAKTPFDPATAKGTFTGQVTLALPLAETIPDGATHYTVDLDLANFSADHMVMDHKVEAAAMKVSANNLGFQIKGDVKIAGTPASLDYRKLRTDDQAEVRLQANLNAAGWSKLGIDVGHTLVGTVPVKVYGHIGDDEKAARLDVNLDLTPARVDDLFPGWSKPAGKAAHLLFTLVNKGQNRRLEDISVDGGGAHVKGTAEIDPSGDIVSANFPTFALGDVDKASLKIDRTTAGVLRVQMRGDVFDGRGFVKSSMAGSSDDDKKSTDVDLDIRLGAIVGFNGETLRKVDLKMSRRSGHVQAFSLKGKLGSDTPLVGELRTRGQHPTLVISTADAGALFRYTDTYAKLYGGNIVVAMDPPSSDGEPLSGTVNLSNFVIRGETALQNIAAGAPSAAHNGVSFTQMQTRFVKAPGQLSIRDGVVRGPILGATIAGKINYTSNRIAMQGTFIPLYDLNVSFGRLPFLGPLMGGKDGLIGSMTFQVAGTPGAPILRVNPASMVAPGIFRKLFEFQGNGSQPQDYEQGAQER